MKRRHFLTLGGVGSLTLLAGLRANRWRDRGANHTPYFRALSSALDSCGLARPTQSEHVFLQFGDIAVYDRGEIAEFWPVFTQGA